MKQVLFYLNVFSSVYRVYLNIRCSPNMKYVALDHYEPSSLKWVGVCVLNVPARSRVRLTVSSTQLSWDSSIPGSATTLKQDTVQCNIYNTAGSIFYFSVRTSSNPDRLVRRFNHRKETRVNLAFAH